ncbi:hypothetical protein MMPV_009327 [Pyropia vietnamensis]
MAFVAAAPLRLPASATSAVCGAPLRGVSAPTVALPRLPGAATIRMDVTTVVGDGEPLESALRRFKKDVNKSGHLFELRRRRYFETTAEKRLRKHTQAQRKARMARNMEARKIVT